MQEQSGVSCVLANYPYWGHQLSMSVLKEAGLVQISELGFLFSQLILLVFNYSVLLRTDKYRMC